MAALVKPAADILARKARPCRRPGTPGGYAHHNKLREKPCDPCRLDHNTRNLAWWRNNKASKEA